MALYTGVDLIEIERIRGAVDRHGRRFLMRIFTPGERELCHDRIHSLAVRFAAKEAVAKVLGTGLWRSGIAWTDIETLRDEQSGAPRLRLHYAAARRAAELRLVEWSISLSHSRDHAIAFVVATSSL
jgi:holo-[acyl-carrier protein] synthase